MTIRIMSSNLWGNCPANRPIANRDDLLAGVFKKYAPWTIGLQECSPKSRQEENNILSLCEPEYLELDPSPTDINNFTPILYSRRLRLDDGGWFLFDGPNDWNSKSVTWGLFSFENIHFFHINAHYFWEHTKEGEQAREQNSAQLLSFIQKLPYLQLPLIVTGDFNCEEYTRPLQMLLSSGFTPASDIAAQKICSHHIYPEFDEENQRYHSGSLFHPVRKAEDSIDHIFLLNATGTRFVTVQDQEALDASDHCPIYADIEIKKTPAGEK